MHSYLKQTTEQFISDFYTQNSLVMERGDSYELVYRLTALSSSMHWACVQVTKDDKLIFQKNRVTDCRSGLFQRVQTVRAKGNPALKVTFTIALPFSLKSILTLFIIFQVFFISLIGWLKISEEKEKLKISLEWKKKIKDIIAQVVHDIRSPLAALKLLLPKERESNILSTATRRIEDILDDLQQNEKRRTFQLECNSIKVISEILEEKNLYIKKYHPAVTLNFDDKNKYQDFILKINHLDLSRILSNLINNAIEAFDAYLNFNPRIDIHVKSTLIDGIKYGVIEVVDNGKGIKPEQLLLLQKVGGSFSKSNGQGLGLKYAKEQLRSLDGFLEIKSVKVNKLENKTSVEILIPFISQTLREQTQRFKIALIDDDSFVHRYWKMASTMAQVELLTYYTYQEFMQADHGKDIPIFLDKNLAGNVCGFDLAEKLYNQDGFHKIFLVTGEDVLLETLPVYFETIVSRKEFPKELIGSLKQSNIQAVKDLAPVTC